MLLVPSRPPTVSRRRVLAGAAALAMVGATSMTAVACGTAPPPPDLDDLTTGLDRARADSSLASEAAAATRGSAADALTEAAAERSAHAEALAEEIVRLTGQAAPTTSVTTTTTTSTASPSAAAPVPTVDDVIGALRASADSAAAAAAALSGYRAGLFASIAAACTTASSVALTPAGGAR
ncbi:hypothetical protein [Mycolicibacterium pyrenivorans]|uniref:hypothetical protein n=1 Tax=Mycolicibacterium pyrenivorans TaxID=187102 RepID=UPI0021F3AFCB|nr:hypothetical protein [Mycolicibacterium pyrenivorans]MCV7151363.1 hypothetical protein [Mycolicibacterium pyrenivorans]